MIEGSEVVGSTSKLLARRFLVPLSTLKVPWTAFEVSDYCPVVVISPPEDADSTPENADPPSNLTTAPPETPRKGLWFSNGASRFQKGSLRFPKRGFTVWERPLLVLNEGLTVPGECPLVSRSALAVPDHVLLFLDGALRFPEHVHHSPTALRDFGSRALVFGRDCASLARCSFHSPGATSPEGEKGSSVPCAISGCREDLPLQGHPVRTSDGTTCRSGGPSQRKVAGMPERETPGPPPPPGA